MNVFQLLRKDHRKVNQIFQRIQETGDRAVKTREKLFSQLQKELEMHATLEETIFYPVLEENQKTRDLIKEAYSEHKEVKQTLSEIEEIPKDSEEFFDRIQELKDSVQHHVEEEEGPLFENASEVLSQQEINELGEQINKAKKEQLSAQKSTKTKRAKTPA